MPLATRARPRSTYHHGDLRRALVTSATDLLGSHGRQGVTLRGAARAAGVSQAAPYRHFASKEALLAAVAEESFRGLRAACAAAYRAARRDPVRRLHAVAAAYVRFAVEHPAHYRLMWAPVPRGSDHPALAAAAAGAGEGLLEAVKACIGAGRLDDRPREFLFVIWSVLHGLAGLIIDGQLPRQVRETVSVDVLVRTAMDVLLDGMRKRP